MEDHTFEHPIGQLTNIRRSDGAPEPNGTLRVVTRKKILHYRQLYIDRPDPIAFMPVVVDTLGRIYDDFLRLLFLHAHREASALANEIPRLLFIINGESESYMQNLCMSPCDERLKARVEESTSEESGHFRFLRAACLANIKGSVGLILAKASAMRISIPLDLSSRPFIPLPRFIRSRRPTTLLVSSLVFSPLRSA
jgi:hypothetical protein